MRSVDGQQPSSNEVQTARSWTIHNGNPGILLREPGAGPTASSPMQHWKRGLRARCSARRAMSLMLRDSFRSPHRLKSESGARASIAARLWRDNRGTAARCLPTSGRAMQQFDGFFGYPGLHRHGCGLRSPTRDLARSLFRLAEQLHRCLLPYRDRSTLRRLRPLRTVRCRWPAKREPQASKSRRQKAARSVRSLTRVDPSLPPPNQRLLRLPQYEAAQ